MKPSEAPNFLLPGAKLPPPKKLKVVASTKPKKRPKGALRVDGDTGTKEMKLRQQVVFENRAYSSTGHPTAVGARVESQFPHDRYYKRGELDPTNSWRNGLLYEAAERLRRDFHASGLSARLCSSFEPRVASGDRQWEADTAVAALDRYKKAMNSVGQSLRPVLFYVCIAGHSASEWSVRNGKDKKVGIEFLRAALAELAHHYGYVKLPSSAVS